MAFYWDRPISVSIVLQMVRSREMLYTTESVNKMQNATPTLTGVTSVRTNRVKRAAPKKTAKRIKGRFILTSAYLP